MFKEETVNKFKLLAGLHPVYKTREKVVSGANPILESKTMISQENRHDGVMIATFVPQSIASEIALTIEDAELSENLHVTWFYFGKRETLSDSLMKRIETVTRSFSKSIDMLQGNIGGFGRFSASESTEGRDVIYLSVDLPEAFDLRFKLKKELLRQGITITEQHGWTPHITLAYVKPSDPNPFERFEPVPIEFDYLSLTKGKREDKEDFMLGTVIDN